MNPVAEALMSEEEKKYLKAKEDILQAAKSISELTEQQQEQQCKWKLQQEQQLKLQPQQFIILRQRKLLNKKFFRQFFKQPEFRTLRRWFILQKIERFSIGHWY